MVIKENFGRDMVDIFLNDLMKTYSKLEEADIKKKDINHRENPSLLY
ncbi:MAG: hypothetical protein PQ968_05665 [Methanobacterium sp.]|jgi:glutamate decarboxylase